MRKLPYGHFVMQQKSYIESAGGKDATMNIPTPEFSSQVVFCTLGILGTLSLFFFCFVFWSYVYTCVIYTLLLFRLIFKCLFAKVSNTYNYEIKPQEY